MFRRMVLVLAILCLCTSGVLAQGINFYASVDRSEMYLDEQITLTISIEGDVQSVPLPRLSGLNQFVVYEAGRSQNFSYVNGQVSSSLRFNYVLMPRMAGKFTIPPIEVSIKGQTHRTSPIEVNVIGAKSRGEPLQTDQIQNKQQAPDLWIETSLDKETAYVGEQVTLTLKFCQGVRLFQNPEYTPPSLTGFWSEDLPPQKKYYQNIGGRRYYVQEIKTALFPTTSGKKTIGAAELRCKVEDLEDFLKIDPFSLLDRDLTQLFSQGKPKILKSKPLSLEVLPLPANQPENFSGAVGDFSLKTELDKTEVEAGQPVTLQITISGTGNIKSVSAPIIPEVPSFRSYNSSSSENISKADYQLQGAKTFEQIFIPNEPGSFTLSPIGFTYFDVNQKKYQTLLSPSYTLTVRSSGAAVIASTPTIENRITNKTGDIHYLKTDLGSAQPGGYFYQTPWFYAMQVFPILAFVLLWRRQAHQEKFLGDRAYARFRLAFKNAKRQLESARQQLTSGREHDFYGQLHKCLGGYLCDKLNLGGSTQFADELIAQLHYTFIPAAEIQLMEKILQQCEQARFGGAPQDKNQRMRLLQETESLLQRLEKINLNNKIKATA
jgi:hypothetical protein